VGLAGRGCSRIGPLWGLGGVDLGPRMAHIRQRRNPLLLNPIEGLTFHEDRHLYRYKGEWLSTSISQVTDVDLKPAQRAAFEKYKDGPDGWKIRGETIHKCLHLHLTGQPQAYDDKWSPWVETLLTDKVFQGVTTLASEYQLCLRTDTESIGGTLDFLLAYDDDPSFRILGDLKTVSSAKGVSSRKPNLGQLGGYLRMLQMHHPSLYVSQCITVVSGPEKVKVREHDPQECLDAWDAALARYQALQFDF
jgi:hypothetical protein